MKTDATGMPLVSELLLVRSNVESPRSELNNALQILEVTRAVDQPRHEIDKNLTAVEGRIRRALKLMVAQ